MYMYKPNQKSGGLFIFTASNAMFNSAVETFNGFGALATIGGTSVVFCVHVCIM